MGIETAKYIPLVKCWLDNAKPCEEKDFGKCQIFKNIYQSSFPVTSTAMKETRQKHVESIARTLVYSQKSEIKTPFYGTVITIEGFLKHYGRLPNIKKDGNRCQLFYRVLLLQQNLKSQDFINSMVFVFVYTTMLFPEWK